jgi:hypothetical protein
MADKQTGTGAQGKQMRVEQKQEIIVKPQQITGQSR